MSVQSFTIAQAAKSLGVSSRTIRRFIKSGKISAELVQGPFGDEYRIHELPSELRKLRPIDSTTSQTPIQTSVHTPSQPLAEMIDIIKELQDKNIALAAQLGAATERIRTLENQVKLLTTTKQSWWKRLFTRKESIGVA